MRNPDAYYEGADASEMYERDGIYSDVERFQRSEERSKEQEEAFLAMSEEDIELLAMLDEDEDLFDGAEDNEP